MKIAAPLLLLPLVSYAQNVAPPQQQMQQMIHQNQQRQLMVQQQQQMLTTQQRQEQLRLQQQQQQEQNRIRRQQQVQQIVPQHQLQDLFPQKIEQGVEHIMQKPIAAIEHTISHHQNNVINPVVAATQQILPERRIQDVTPPPVPVDPTPAPVEPTPAPVPDPTPAPVDPTPAPVPVDPTPAPVNPTPSPVDPTPAPTLAPVDPTPAPVVPTPAPVTPAPVVPTTSAPSLSPTKQAFTPSGENAYGNANPEDGPWPECVGWEGQDCRTYIETVISSFGDYNSTIGIAQTKTGNVTVDFDVHRVKVFIGDGLVIRIPQRG